MSNVKTYENVNRENESLSFGISRMEDVHEKLNGKTDDPHRHNFFTILLIKHARGEHKIDFNSYELGPNTIFFLSPGQVHQVIEAEKSFGYSIVFSHQFLAQNNIPISFIDNLNLFNDFGETPPIPLGDEEIAKLTEYAEEMISLNQSDVLLKYDAIGSLVKLLLIRSNNLCSVKRVDLAHIETGNTVLRKFKNLINQKYANWHGTKEYADALNITPDHLNRVVKSLTGKTAKEHIQSRIVTAAKRLIYFTSLSNKEIGFELGFSEPANFSAFFKKCTGISPSKFKEKN
ncbi:AraC family transcriptional regulator [Crocinitomix algicola]|uniref:AraC family transcriptional regulator n=1 Tax=Crocinitomix algicola TaxID=1740263 RepID=UPI000831DE7A|nr:helix-turn-helix transcriptional regulator [Crocinitomix algicola]